MNKLTKAIIAIFALLVIAVITLSVYIGTNKLHELRADNAELIIKNEQLQLVIDIKDFQYGAKVIGKSDLKDRLELRKEEIVELEQEKIDEITAEDYISIIEYCVVYIHYAQRTMAENGLNYPNFILESILNDILEERIENNSPGEIN